MTEETYEWLNENTLVGFGDKRGGAWWPMDPAYNNLYPAAIPVEDAVKFFGRWRPVMADVMFEDESGKLVGDSEAGKIIYRHQPGSPLHHKRMGIHESGYQIHDRVKWLINNVATILDDGLAIATVIELRGGRMAAVQMEMPETVEHSSGERMRPFIAAMTSLDGSLSTTYKLGETRIVCDNTLGMFRAERGAEKRVKHTKYSTTEFSIQSAREALDIINAARDDFTQEMEAMMSTKVTDKQWASFMDLAYKIPETPGGPKTRMENTRMAIEDLYFNDARVSPWKGTQWGVLQAVNTYQTHIATVKKVGRVERQWENFLKGKSADSDRSALDKLALVLSNK